MAVRLSALRAGSPAPPGRFLLLISVRGLVDPRVIAGLEGLGQFKSPVTSSEIEPATFRLVAQYLNHLRYSLLPENDFLCRAYIDVRLNRGMEKAEANAHIQAAVTFPKFLLL
jgi:hypothetical protein